MIRYSGITTNLDRRKKEHESDHPNLKNWTVANNGKSFTNREKAQEWEDKQPEEHHGGGRDSGLTWYGYYYEY